MSDANQAIEGAYQGGKIQFDARSFTFAGQRWADYNLLQDGNFHIVGDWQAVYGPNSPLSTLHRVVFTLPDGSTVTVDGDVQGIEASKVLVRVVTSTGYEWDCWAITPTDGSLDGQPRLDLYSRIRPSSFNTATGMFAQETGNDTGGQYLVSSSST